MKTLFHHALAVDETNGMLTPRRFSIQQLAYLQALGEVVYHSASSCAGITLEFLTDADTVCFSYTASMYRRPFLHFDIYEDDILCEQIRIDGKPALGKLCYTRRQPGESHIRIFLPYSCKISLYDFQAGNWRPLTGAPIDYLALGDSITLGSDADAASFHFPSLLSHTLGLNGLNQGIGTFYHDPAFIRQLPDISPRLITLGYGSNDLNHLDFSTAVSHIKAVHELIHERFSDALVIVLTPIWRAQDEDDTPLTAQFKQLLPILSQSARKHNFQVVDGYCLTPHLPRYYYDATLHPDARGFLYYTLDFLRQLSVRLPFDISERTVPRGES